jgi:ribosomal protein S18 acetylase RimI-like enzyme
MTRVAERSITLRAVADSDTAFLFDVYASTRAEELAALNWDDASRAAFLTMQFRAQAGSYRQQFPNATFDLILVDREPAGRLYVNRCGASIHVIDIALRPVFRNSGIGSAVLRWLQHSAAAEGVPVTLHVERSNPALRLYTRLGFRVVADLGVYLRLEW